MKKHKIKPKLRKILNKLLERETVKVFKTNKEVIREIKKLKPNPNFSVNQQTDEGGRIQADYETGFNECKGGVLGFWENTNP